jgi:hypothetical protein
MSKPTREQIERRAYELWQRAGFPHGHDEEFYLRAEQELHNQGCSLGMSAMKNQYPKKNTPRQYRP